MGANTYNHMSAELVMWDKSWRLKHDRWSGNALLGSAMISLEIGRNIFH